MYLSAVVGPAATPPYRAARKKYKNQYVDFNFFLQTELCVKQPKKKQRKEETEKTKRTKYFKCVFCFAGAPVLFPVKSKVYNRSTKALQL